MSTCLKWVNQMFPQQIGRFEIQGQIADNERGTVFRAFDPQLQREVAVKLLKTQHLYTMTAQRIYKEEAEKIRRLNHAAILPVYDYGDEDTRPYIVMPLTPGGSLTDQLKKNGPLPLGKAVEIFTLLADALDYAASMGVYHLDLKPNNVLFDQHGHPFLSNLGLVQIIDALTTAKARITNSSYISPEQVRGRTVDARSQVYSLGAMLFESLTGQPLFGGASEMVTAFKHVSERPRRPRSLRPDLPEAVDQVLLRAVEKRPEDRFQSAREMMRMLERAQGGLIPPEVVMQEQTQSPFGGTLPPSGGVRTPATGWTFAREPGRRGKAVNTTSIILIGVSIACVFCLGLGGMVFFLSAADLSTTNSSATQTAVAQAAQVEATRVAFQAATVAAEVLRAEVSAWPVLMSDSFDDNANNWVEDEMDDDEYASINWDIQDGQYRWEATAIQGFVWRVWPEISRAEDFYVSVDVQHTSGIGNAQYGIIFRNSEEPVSYYYFEVHETREFSIFFFNDESWETLVPLTSSTAIVPGQVNQLEVVGQGEHFVFFINDVFVGEVVESSLTVGEVGLAIGLPDEGNTAVIVFDNFEVKTP
jgi:hypothetical protein